MSEPHVISALVAKRAEIAGMIHDLDLKRAALAVDLEHVDRVLMMYGYKGLRQIRAKKPLAPPLFARREVPLYLRELERTGVTKGVREIALALIERRGWDAGDNALVKKAIEAVRSARKALARQARAP
jgi:hypothetical protein